jgi:hypothetical protein
MLHLSTFHAANAISWASNLFRRKRKPRILLRDQPVSDGHPSEVVERSTEGLIIQASLKMALDKCGLPDHPFSLFCFEPSWARQHRRGENIRNGPGYKIGCLLEELIVSGNDEYFDLPDTLERKFEGLMKRKMHESASYQYDFTQRRAINAWFLQILEKSPPLRMFLALGKVAPEMAKVTSPGRFAPIIALWDTDEAAIGIERICEISDGAVDSRDDLKPTSDSEGPLASDDSNNAEMTSWIRSPFAPPPETNHLVFELLNDF